MKSVKCDARPAITFPAAERRCPAAGWYQLIVCRAYTAWDYRPIRRLSSLSSACETDVCLLAVKTTPVLTAIVSFRSVGARGLVLSLRFTQREELIISLSEAVYL